MKTTFKKRLIKIWAPILLGGVTMLAFLSACGGSDGAATPAPPAPTPSTATPKTTATSHQPTPTVNNGRDDLLASGRLIFDKTAGGVGCAYCHGLDGKGKGTSGAGTPDIRGAPENQVRGAIAGGVPAMSFIKLSEAELMAVVAYLQYLNEQPQGRP